jgi:hypothetical protein
LWVVMSSGSNPRAANFLARTEERRWGGSITRWL